MRAIVFLLFVVLVFLVVRFTLNRIIEIRAKQRQQDLEAENPQKKGKQEEPQEMVRCAFCGVHLPQSEAFYDGKDTFCSEGHMHEYHKQQQEKQDQD